MSGRKQLGGGAALHQHIDSKSYLASQISHLAVFATTKSKFWLLAAVYNFLYG